ncbi:hypothetical protein EHO57_13940 [Leptospira langatensis]|uniref:Uncharacterized protein n=1 Tax=Leptospira langatensis TaxID=2484983 RepID=A0A5R2ASZ2_9LEPT|nr:hypothetical protein [Leptospira langatensis]TGJ99857.1 hypothetical protein EHO57_13940 [Leptospira langatensis]
MEFHRLIIQLLQRTANATESETEHIENQYQVQQPQVLTRLITKTDNLVVFPIPAGITFKYVLIKASYNQEDTALAKKEGDLAPIAIRRDGATDDQILPDGWIAWGGNIVNLQISTPYETNKVKVEVFLGA